MGLSVTLEAVAMDMMMGFLMLTTHIDSGCDHDFLSCISDWNPTQHWLEMTMATIRVRYILYHKPRVKRPGCNGKVFSERYYFEEH